MENKVQKTSIRFLLVITLCLGAVLPALLMASDPPVNGIPYRKARSIALKARHGKIKNFEQRQWKGIWVFDFKIQGDDLALHEVVVEATTGKVLMGAPKHNSKKHKKTKPTHTTSRPAPELTPQ